MAGHRKATGRPTQAQNRSRRAQSRVALAATAEDQLAASYDWFRIAAWRVKDAAARGRLLHSASDFLAQLAADAERSA